MRRASQILSPLVTRFIPKGPVTFTPPIQLHPDIPIEEERKDKYNAKQYYPVKVGEVFDNKYQVAFKVGYGGHSTVWLARNIQRSNWLGRHYAVLKICTNLHPDERRHEVDLLLHLASVNPAHPGLKYIHLLQDHFEIRGPEGIHMCLVFKPMREPLWLLQKRFPEGRYDLTILRYTVSFLLSALEYLHSECHIIHTDLKPENILIGFESKLSLDELVEAEEQAPYPRKDLPDRTIYLSRTDFGAPKSALGRPKISDFDAAVRGDGPGLLQFGIQPNRYRAPEVTLGAPWSYSVDIWNLGVMLWDLLEAKPLCDGIDSRFGREYSSHVHLAQLIRLLGPPPKELLDRGVNRARYFDAQGEWLGQLEVPTTSLSNSVTSLEDEEKEEFLRFVNRMLQWLPEDRATAQELLDDPLIRGLQ